MNTLQGSAFPHMSHRWSAMLLAAVMLCVLATGAFATNALGVPDAEYDALVALYNATDGDNWYNRENWLTENTPWHGVIVSAGHVTGIDLDFNGLSGPIPSDIGDLANLQNLDLSYNALTGAIPAEIGSLSNLKFLNLQNNQLTGPIPSEIGDLTNLITLYVEDNDLSGGVPAWLGGLSKLQGLGLSWNEFTGQIPPEIGNLTDLGYLGLRGNCLTGAVPPQIGNLTNLYGLGLDDNMLEGPLPEELGNLTKLNWCTLGGNLFEGEIPAWMTNLTGLLAYGLNLDHCRFTCSDPTVLAFLADKAPNWANTQTIPPTDVSVVAGPGSAIMSWTPIDYWYDYGYYEVGVSSTPGGPYEFLPQNRTSDKSANGLTVARLPIGTHYLVVRTVTTAGWRNQSTLISLPSAEVSAEVLETGTPLGVSQSEYDALVALYNATNGDNWYNRENWLTPYTPWYGVTVEDGHVVGIDLYNNGLSGFIPPEIGDLTSLQYLRLGWNRIGGQIPAEIGSLANLLDLSLSNNELTGRIPAEIGNLANLQELDLAWNQLSDSIPSSIGNLSNLRGLDLRVNQLTGRIPPEIGNLANLLDLSLSNNELTGRIPAEIGNLLNLRDLSLYWNELTGAIPPELGGLVNLENLSVFWNQLTGPIPAEIGNLSRLYNLDLNYNRITGPIPTEIGNMSSLNVLQLGGNQLSGSIPSSIGNLTNLTYLWLASNQLTGEIPHSITNLTRLQTRWGGDIGYNGLYSSDPEVISFLEDRMPEWDDTQTVQPTNVSAQIVQPGCVVVSWTPIPYTDDEGYYEIGVGATPGGPYTFSEWNRTGSKRSSSTMVVDFPADSSLYLVVRTVTLAGWQNQSTLVSEVSAEASVPAPGRAMRIGEAKRLQDGEEVIISNLRAGMGWLETADTFKAYIQEWDRSAGIAVRLPLSIMPDEDDEDEDVRAVSLTGVMATQDGERYIDVSSVYLAFGDKPDTVPLGIGCLTGYKGLDISGLHIKTWGKVIEAPEYEAGVHPNWFRLSDASGTYKVVWPLDYGEIDDNRILIPVVGTPMRILGICSGLSGEKTVYYDPEYEVDALNSFVYESGCTGWVSIEDRHGQATAMAISGPGLDGWQPLQIEEYDDWGGRYWRGSWDIPSPLPAAPAEYLIRITEDGHDSYYKAWITNFMTEMPTDLRPEEYSHVTGPLTFSWTLPTTGGPFRSFIALYKQEQPYSRYLVGYPEAGSGSSYTYSGPLETGQYLWWLCTYDRDGNGCMPGGGYFWYDSGSSPPTPPGF